MGLIDKNVNTTICSQTHKIRHQAPHPAVVLSKPRIEAWKHDATDEEFYQFIGKLSKIYAARHQGDNHQFDENLLFKHFKAWRDS